jgi:hypothetical protein
MTTKTTLLLNYIAKGIDSKWVKGLCREWGVDAKHLPFGRGIDVMGTLQRLAEHAIKDNSQSTSEYAIVFNGDSLDVFED